MLVGYGEGYLQVLDASFADEAVVNCLDHGRQMPVGRGQTGDVLDLLDCDVLQGLVQWAMMIDHVMAPLFRHHEEVFGREAVPTTVNPVSQRAANCSNCCTLVTDRAQWKV